MVRWTTEPSSITPREWTAGHAADQADEVGVVNMQVDGRTAAPPGVGDLARPVGFRDHSHEVGRP